MTAGDNGARFKDNRIVIDGWATASGNWSSAENSNLPESYWIVPNSFQLDQLCFRFARVKIPSKRTTLTGASARSCLTAKTIARWLPEAGDPGYQDYILMNKLYGLDFTEQYFEVYLPPGKGGIFEGTVIRCGRWIACPDIETQYGPDNYLGSHLLLFTYDTYTQTGIMFTVKLNMNWMVQAAITAGTDMAPWYVGATPCGFAGLRWEATDGCNAIYTCLNDFDGAEFRRFIQPGTDAAAGHDNYNYVVSTWEHKFSDLWHTATESYFMWQDNAYLGGTVSVGPYQPYGNNGTNRAPPGSARLAPVLLPGWSFRDGVLNYTEYAVSQSDYICFRNEWWRDQRGYVHRLCRQRHQQHDRLQPQLQLSALNCGPEVGYFRNCDQAAFDDGTLRGIWQYGFDVTYHW